MTASTAKRRAGPIALAGAIALVALAGAAHAQAPWHRTSARYRVPDVALLRSDGASVHFRGELDDGRPVILNFVFTTCTAVCPLMSHSFAQLDKELGGEVHLISISIDPEHDTPARLSSYAAQLHAGPHWSFYTGTLEASIALQRAFGVYRGDKMSHDPLTFVRAAPGEAWLRIEGFAPADAIVAAYRQLRAGAP
jgi:protein SCO1/2